MSGWTPVEKAILGDIRFIRLVRNFVDSNAPALQERRRVTLLLGALVQLWLHADEYIRDDNTIRATLDDIDHLVGIENFGKQLPSDWFMVVDSNNVQLPDWLEHNGTISKKRLLNRQRVERHRAKFDGNAPPLQDQPPGNAPTLPDQTTLPHPKPSQTTRREKESPESKGSRLPKDWQPSTALIEYAQDHGLDPAAVLERFRDHWAAAAGAKGRKADWDATWRTWCRNENPTRSIGPKPNGHDSPARQAWRELISSRGATRGPREQAAILAIGGWSAIAERTPYTETKIEREFCEAWERQ